MASVTSPRTTPPRAPKRGTTSSLIGMGMLAVGGGLVLLLLAQLIPYGRAHTNPPVTGQPAWDSPQTQALAMRACGDCHSNETTWPWYSNVAPISWLIQHDVNAGRGRLNFSEWNASSRGGGQAAEDLQSGRMPPVYYGWLHPDSVLTGDEKQALIQGLRATFGSESEGPGGEGRGERRRGD